MSKIFIIASLTRFFFLAPLCAQEVSQLESHLEKFQTRIAQKERLFHFDETLKLVKTQGDINLLKNHMLVILEKENENPYIARESLLKISKEIYGRSFIIDLLYVKDGAPRTFTTEYNRLNHVLGVISYLQLEYALPHLHSFLRQTFENSLEFQSRYFRNNILAKTLEAIGKINHSESVFYIIQNYENKSDYRTQWTKALMHFASWQRPYFPGKKIVGLTAQEIKQILEFILNEKMVEEQHDSFFIATMFLMRLSDNLPKNLLGTYLNMVTAEISQKRIQFIQEFLEKFDTLDRLIVPGVNSSKEDNPSSSGKEVMLTLFNVLIPVLIFTGHEKSEMTEEKKEEIRIYNTLYRWYDRWTLKISQ